MTAPKSTNILKTLIRISRRALYGFAALMLIGGLSACEDKNEPDSPGSADPELPEGHTYIAMLVSTGASSRADFDGAYWGDDYNSESASRFEKTIDSKRIHVALFDTEGVPVADLYSGKNAAEVIVRTISIEEGKYYIYFDISELDLKEKEDYIVAVMVNYDSQFTPSGARIDNSTFSLSSVIGETGGNSPYDYYKGAIPMFGFTHWTFGKYAEPDDINEIPIIGRIPLIRAVCKIEVRLADPEQYPRTARMSIDENRSPRLAYVNGRHLNTRGHIAPAKYRWTNPLRTSTLDLSFYESYYELTGYRWTSPADEEENRKDHFFLPARSADGKTYYAYLPEASGLSLEPNPDALRLNVTVNYDPGNGRPVRQVTGTLFPSVYYDEENQKYPDYVNYNRWKLYRNHIYRFTITDIADETNLKYNVSVSGEQTVNVPNFE